MLSLLTAFGAAMAPAASAMALNKPVVGIASYGSGYWLTAGDGGVFALGGVAYRGSVAGTALQGDVSGIAARSDGLGYWLVARDGGVFAFNSTYASCNFLESSYPVVGIAPTASNQGYWLVNTKGAVKACGDAVHQGDTAQVTLNKPVVGIIAVGSGYRLVAADGGVFDFGVPALDVSTRAAATDYVGIAGTPSGKGFWLARANGAVQAFGDAAPLGDAAGVLLNQPVVGIAGYTSPTGQPGYWLTAGDGGIFSYGAAPYRGSLVGDDGPPAKSEKDLRDAIVARATQDVGYVEVPATPDRSNCNAYYAECQAWAPMFASRVWLDADVRDFSMTTWTPNVEEWAKQRQHWKDGATATPEPGDLAVYQVATKGRPAHVGVVVQVGSDGRIVTVDGNLTDRVVRSGPFLPSDPAGPPAAGVPGVLLGYASPVAVPTSTAGARASTTGPTWTPLPAPGQEGADPDGTGELHVLPRALRVASSRSGQGLAQAPLAPGTAVDVQVGGRAGVPASDVASVLLTVTTLSPSGSGVLQAYAPGPRPATPAAVHYRAGQRTATTLTVPVNPDGRVRLRNSGSTTDVVVVVAGWTGTVLNVPGARLAPLPSQRLYDSTSSGGALAPGAVRKVSVLGRAGVPASGVSAVAVQVTATAGGTATGVTAYGSGTSRPQDPQVQAPAGAVRTGHLVLPVGADGKVALHNAAGSTQVRLDVVGWYGATPGARAFAASAKVLDQSLPSGTGVTVRVAGQAGVPTDATAVDVALVGTAAGAGTALTVRPADGTTAPPSVYVPGSATASDVVVVKVDSQGRIRISNSGSSARVTAVVLGFHR